MQLRPRTPPGFSLKPTKKEAPLLALLRIGATHQNASVFSDDLLNILRDPLPTGLKTLLVH